MKPSRAKGILQDLVGGTRDYRQAKADKKAQLIAANTAQTTNESIGDSRDGKIHKEKRTRKKGSNSPEKPQSADLNTHESATVRFYKTNAQHPPAPDHGAGHTYSDNTVSLPAQNPNSHPQGSEKLLPQHVQDSTINPIYPTNALSTTSQSHPNHSVHHGTIRSQHISVPMHPLSMPNTAHIANDNVQWRDPGTVLESMYHYLQMIKGEFPLVFTQHLTPRSHDIEVTLNTLVQVFRSYCQELEILRGKIDRMQTEMKSLEIQRDNDLNENNRICGERIASMRTENGRETSRLEGEVRVWREQFNTVDQRADDRIKMKEGQFVSEKFDMVAGYELQLQNLKQEIEGHKVYNVEQLKLKDSATRTELSRARRDFQAEKGEITQEFTGKRNQLQGQLDERNSQLASMMSDYDVEREKLKEDHTAEIAILNRKWKQKVDDLTKALAKRDLFKPMSDHDLASAFQNIGAEVDEFARVVWDRELKSTWPISEGSLKNVKNDRKAKQYIIQNTLWVILYEKLFCTPFQIFGREGELIHRKWVGTYGTKPTRESEKWRYDNIKGYAEATRQPLHESGPNYQIYKSYQSCLKETKEDILHELSKVAIFDLSEENTISEVVEKAAKLWLDAGQQRCRLFLLMSKSGDPPVRARATALDDDGMMDLVIVPELRRYGNAQGERLDKDELVMDCRGHFSVYPSLP